MASTFLKTVELERLLSQKKFEVVYDHFSDALCNCEQAVEEFFYCTNAQKVIYGALDYFSNGDKLVFSWDECDPNALIELRDWHRFNRETAAEDRREAEALVANGYTQFLRDCRGMTLCSWGRAFERKQAQKRREDRDAELADLQVQLYKKNKGLYYLWKRLSGSNGERFLENWRDGAFSRKSEVKCFRNKDGIMDFEIHVNHFDRDITLSNVSNVHIGNTYSMDGKKVPPFEFPTFINESCDETIVPHYEAIEIREENIPEEIPFEPATQMAVVVDANRVIEATVEVPMDWDEIPAPIPPVALTEENFPPLPSAFEEEDDEDFDNIDYQLHPVLLPLVRVEEDAVSETVEAPGDVESPVKEEDIVDDPLDDAVEEEDSDYEDRYVPSLPSIPEEDESEEENQEGAPMEVELSCECHHYTEEEFFQLSYEEQDFLCNVVCCFSCPYPDWVEERQRLCTQYQEAMDVDFVDEADEVDIFDDVEEEDEEDQINVILGQTGISDLDAYYQASIPERVYPTRIYRQRVPRLHWNPEQTLDQQIAFWIAQGYEPSQVHYKLQQAKKGWLQRCKAIAKLEVELRELELLQEEIEESCKNLSRLPPLINARDWRCRYKSQLKKKKIYHPVEKKYKKIRAPRFSRHESAHFLNYTDKTFYEACEFNRKNYSCNWKRQFEHHCWSAPAQLEEVPFFSLSPPQSPKVIEGPTGDIVEFPIFKNQSSEDPVQQEIFIEEIRKLIGENFQNQSKEEVTNPIVKKLYDFSDLLTNSIKDMTFTDVEDLLGKMKPMTSFHLFSQMWHADNFMSVLHYVTMFLETHNVYWTSNLMEASEWLIDLISRLINVVKSHGSIQRFFEVGKYKKAPRCSMPSPKEEPIDDAKSDITLSEYQDATSGFHNQAIVEDIANPESPYLLKQLGIDVNDKSEWTPWLWLIGVVGVIITLVTGTVCKLSDGFIRTCTNSFESVSKLMVHGDNFFKKMKSLFDWIMEKVCSFVGCKWIPDEDVEIHKFKDEAVKTYKQVLALYDKVKISPVFLFRDDSAFIELKEAVKKCDSMYADLFKIRKNVCNVKPIMDNLKEKYNHVLKVMADIRGSFMTKQEPTCLYFAGPSGVGKSKLISHVVETLSKLEGKFLHTYTRFAGDEYNSAYQGQDVFVYDDFNRAADDTDLNELDAIYTPAAYSMNMADLSEKGRFFSSRYVIICSNMPYNRAVGMYQPDILDRRRDHLIWVESPQLDEYRNAHGGELPGPDSGFYKPDFSHLKFTKKDCRRTHADDPGKQYPLEYFILDAFRLQILRRKEWLKSVANVAAELKYSDLRTLSKEDEDFINEQYNKCKAELVQIQEYSNFGLTVPAGESFLSLVRSMQLEQQETANPKKKNFKNQALGDKVPNHLAVCLRVEPPPKVLLLGPAGCGKTTLVQQYLTICEVRDGKKVCKFSAAAFQDAQEMRAQLLCKECDVLLLDDWCINKSVFEIIQSFIFSYDQQSYPGIKKVVMTANTEAFEKRMSESNWDSQTRDAFKRRFTIFNFAYRVKPVKSIKNAKLASALARLSGAQKYNAESFKTAMHQKTACYDDCVTISQIVDEDEIVCPSATIPALIDAVECKDIDTYAQLALPVIGMCECDYICSSDDTMLNLCGLFSMTSFESLNYLRKHITVEKGSMMAALSILQQFRAADDTRKVIQRHTADGYMIDVANRRIKMDKHFSMLVKCTEASFAFTTDDELTLCVFKVLPEAKVDIEGNYLYVRSAEEVVKREMDLTYKTAYTLNSKILANQKSAEEIKIETSAFESFSNSCVGLWQMFKMQYGSFVRVVIFLVRMVFCGFNMAHSWTKAAEFQSLRKLFGQFESESDLGKEPAERKWKNRKLRTATVNLEASKEEMDKFESESEPITPPKKTKIIEREFSLAELELESIEHVDMKRQKQKHIKREVRGSHDDYAPLSRSAHFWKNEPVFEAGSANDESIEHVDMKRLRPKTVKAVAAKSFNPHTLEYEAEKVEINKQFESLEPVVQRALPKAGRNVLASKSYLNWVYESCPSSCPEWDSEMESIQTSTRDDVVKISKDNVLHPLRVNKFEIENIDYKTIMEAFMVHIPSVHVAKDKRTWIMTKMTEIIIGCTMSNGQFRQTLYNTGNKMLFCLYTLRNVPEAKTLPKNWFGVCLMAARKQLDFQDQVMADASAGPIIKCIRDNIIDVVGLAGDRLCGGLMLKQHIGITVCHVCSDDRKTLTVGINGHRFEAQILKRDVYYDWLVFRIPKTAGMFKDITHFLPEEKNYADYNLCDAVLVTVEPDDHCKQYIYKPIRLSSVRVNDIQGVKRYGIMYNGTTIGYSYTSPVNTVRGDCGQPVIALDSTKSKKLVAIHSAGSERFGIGSLLLKSMVEELENQAYEDDDICILPHQMLVRNVPPAEVPENFEWIAKLEYHQFFPTQTTLWRSPLAPNWIPDIYEPSILSQHDTRLQDKSINVYKDAISKWGNPQPELDLQELDIVYDEIAEWYASKALLELGAGKVFVLTKTEAINRVTGMEKSNPIYRGSSAGYPWKHYTRTAGKNSYFQMVGEGEKSHWIIAHTDLGQKLHNGIDAIINCASEGKRSAVVFTGSLKDEPLKVKKIYEEPKTRSFAGAPLDFTIAMRKYFHGAYCAISALYNVAPAKVGIDPNSEDWGRLYHYFAELSPYAFDADYKNWDAFIPYEFMKRVPVVYNRIYEYCDPNWSEQDNVIRTALHSCMWGPLLSYYDEVVRAPGGNVSGQPGTTVDNCIVNFAYFYYAWRQIMRQNNLNNLVPFNQFMALTRLGVYGDDNVCALSPRIMHIFNLETYSKFMKDNLGITVTDALKTGLIEPYKELHEVEFLKRNFVRVRNKWLAPLIMDVFSKMFCWTNHTQRHYFWKSQREVRFLPDVLDCSAESLLREAFNHGPSFFHKCRRHILDVFSKLQIPSKGLISFNQLMEERGILIGDFVSESICDHVMTTYMGKPIRETNSRARFFLSPVFLAKKRHAAMGRKLKSQLNFYLSPSGVHWGVMNSKRMEDENVAEEQEALVRLFEKVKIHTGQNFDHISWFWTDKRNTKEEMFMENMVNNVCVVSFYGSAEYLAFEGNFCKRMYCKPGSLLLLGNCFREHYKIRVNCLADERLVVVFSQTSLCPPLPFLGEVTDEDLPFQFPKSKVEYEQYITPQQVVKFCFDSVKDDLEGRNIVDLGAGTGALSSYALSLNPKSLTTIELDEDLKPILTNNVKGENVYYVFDDIRSYTSKLCPVVISNPPFGCHEDGAFEWFLDAVVRLKAPVAYFFMLKADTIYSAEYLAPKGYKTEVLHIFPYSIPKTMSHHKHDNYYIACAFVKFTNLNVSSEYYNGSIDYSFNSERSIDSLRNQSLFVYSKKEENMSAPPVPEGQAGQLSSTTDLAGTTPLASIANSGPSIGEVVTHTTQQNTLDVVLSRQYVIADTVDWAVGDSIGTVIWSKPIHPQFTNIFIKYFQRAYNTWGGGFDYRVTLAGTGFHAGKLGLFKVPPNYNLERVESLSRLSIFPHVILDPKQLEAEFVYGTDQRYANFHWANFDKENPASFGGYMALVVMIPLNTSASGEQRIGAQIAIKAADKFTMAQLRPPMEAPVPPEPPIPVPTMDFEVVRGASLAWAKLRLKNIYTVEDVQKYHFGISPGSKWLGYQSHVLRNGEPIFKFPYGTNVWQQQFVDRTFTKNEDGTIYCTGEHTNMIPALSTNLELTGEPGFDVFVYKRSDKSCRKFTVTDFKTDVSVDSSGWYYKTTLNIGDTSSLDSISYNLIAALENYAFEGSSLSMADHSSDMLFRMTLNEFPICLQADRRLVPMWQTEEMRAKLFSGWMRRYNDNTDPIFHVSVGHGGSEDTFLGYVRLSRDGILYGSQSVALDIQLEGLQRVRFRYEQDLDRNKPLSTVFSKTEKTMAKMHALALKLDAACRSPAFIDLK